jgi:hypothetical protein
VDELSSLFISIALVFLVMPEQGHDEDKTAENPFDHFFNLPS